MKPSSKRSGPPSVADPTRMITPQNCRGYCHGPFSTLEEQNAFLREWETSVADTRIHGTTRKQVGKLFQEAEREALLPLAPAVRRSLKYARHTSNRR